MLEPTEKTKADHTCLPQVRRLLEGKHGLHRLGAYPNVLLIPRENIQNHECVTPFHRKSSQESPSVGGVARSAWVPGRHVAGDPLPQNARRPPCQGGQLAGAIFMLYCARQKHELAPMSAKVTL